MPLPHPAPFDRIQALHTGEMKFKNRMVITQGVGFIVLPLIAGA